MIKARRNAEMARRRLISATVLLCRPSRQVTVQIAGSDVAEELAGIAERFGIRMTLQEISDNVQNLAPERLHLVLAASFDGFEFANCLR